VDELQQVPTAIWVLAGIALIGIIATLIDLALHDVKQLPRAAWAAIIAFVSFPIGAALYFAVGRVSGPRNSNRQPSASSTLSPPQGLAHGIDIRPADNDVASQDAPPVASASRPAIISTSGLAKQYGDIWALRDVDLEVPKHSTYGLIGPNGAGKTTMLSILAGLRRPSHGQVSMTVDRAQIAVVIDTPQFEPWLTAREIVDLARHLTADALPVDRVDESLARVGLTEAADRRVAGFSRGMLQRLGLATGLVGQPDVLILDEPSSALDPAGRREVLDLIGELSGTITIVLSTHVLADVQQVCDVVGVIDKGTLKFQGPIEELLARTSTVYALHVRGDATPLTQQLTQEPWVTSVTSPGPGRLRIVVDDASQAERRIPDIVASSGVGLASFSPATDLETAFLELTS